MTLLALLAGFGLIITVALSGLGRWRERRRVRRLLDRRIDLLAPAMQGAGLAVEWAWLDQARERAPLFLRRAIARADLDIAPPVLIALFGGLLIVVLAGLSWGGLFGMVLAAGIAAALPLLYLKRLADRRMAGFVELLPHYLDSIRQLLLVGSSFQQALGRSTQEAQEPIQRYLRPAIRRIGNGAPVVDSLETVADRIDLPEFHMVVSAVRTNARFGGSIAPTLAGLVRLLRDRARVMRELSAASAETRLSAMVLCALPPVALLIISLVNYGYTAYLWETGAGRRLLLIGLAFQVAGVLVIRRLMRLDF